MEAKCLSKAQRLSLDIISTLPQAITEIILCLLPVQEAARTSILSRDWRYKWTTIPKLVFIESTVSESESESEGEAEGESESLEITMNRHIFLYAIQQILLLRQGPIQEFTLSTSSDHHCFEIDQIMHHLSRNHTVKKLTLSLDSTDRRYHKLPSSTFALRQLTDLRLFNIDLDHQPVFFSGFPRLKSLRLFNVKISTKALLHLLSNCPSLTTFYLLSRTERFHSKDCTIIELFDCLPVIEHLTIHDTSMFPYSLPKVLPASLIHLKYLCLKDIWFVCHDLCCLAVLIKCSPNLEKIRLEMIILSDEDDDDEGEIYLGIVEEHSDIRLEHLTELEIEVGSNMNAKMEFIKFMKFILARSPKLKKVWISCEFETDEERLEILETLLQAPHASPLEIVVV